MPFYTTVVPTRPIVIPGKASHLGLWVKAASDWGRMVYCLPTSVLVEQTFLRRRRGHQRRLDPAGPQRLGRARADRRDLGPLTAGPAKQLARAVRAGHDDPVVSRHLDRLVAKRLDLEKRAEQGLVSQPSDRFGELVRLGTRARDDHPHGSAASNSPATTSGSAPLRRSIHRPSSSATSAVSARASRSRSRT